jgi:hypothetical protein
VRAFNKFLPVLFCCCQSPALLSFALTVCLLSSSSTTFQLKEVQKLRVHLFKDDALRRCCWDPECSKLVTDEALELVRNPEVLWRSLDLNKDGHVTWTEFKSLAPDTVFVSPFDHIVARYQEKTKARLARAGTESQPSLLPTPSQTPPCSLVSDWP